MNPYGRRKSTKTSGVHFFCKLKLLLFSHELAYVRINISSNTWNGYTDENQDERLFFSKDSIPMLVSRTVKTRKFKLLCFRSEISYGNGNLYKDLLFGYLQPSVNKNSWNLAILTLQFDDGTVKRVPNRVFLSVIPPQIFGQSRNPEGYFWHPTSRAYFQSRISPRFPFKIPNPEPQIREIPHPEKLIGDPLWKPSTSTV